MKKANVLLKYYDYSMDDYKTIQEWLKLYLDEKNPLYVPYLGEIYDKNENIEKYKNAIRYKDMGSVGKATFRRDILKKIILRINLVFKTNLELTGHYIEKDPKLKKAKKKRPLAVSKKMWELFMTMYVELNRRSDNKDVFKLLEKNKYEYIPENIRKEIINTLNTENWYLLLNEFLNNTPDVMTEINSVLDGVKEIIRKDLINKYRCPSESGLDEKLDVFFENYAACKKAQDTFRYECEKVFSNASKEETELLAEGNLSNEKIIEKFIEYHMSNLLKSDPEIEEEEKEEKYKLYKMQIETILQHSEKLSSNFKEAEGKLKKLEDIISNLSNDFEQLATEIVTYEDSKIDYGFMLNNILGDINDI